MSESSQWVKNRQMLLLLAVAAGLLASVILVYWYSADGVQLSAQEFDRANLREVFAGIDYDNDPLLDTYLLPARGVHNKLLKLPLLGLQRDRFAYLAKRAGEVVAIAVPATADDGFNGSIDLLVAIDMYGRINAARVITDIETHSLYGVVDVIESHWMRGFSGISMRDVKNMTWQTITSEREYDQFVGASITPKAVAERIYNAMIFFQSNRIELMRGE